MRKSLLLHMLLIWGHSVVREFEAFGKVEIDFKQGLQLVNIETAKFHIPKTQIKQLSTKPELEFMEDKIDGIQTFNFYQTSGSGLKLAKENLEKIIKR